MNVKKTIINENEISLLITAHETDLSPLKQNVIKKMAADVKIPGFRPGTAPINLVEKNLNGQILQSEVLEAGVNRYLKKAVEAERLRPVSEPSVSLKKFVPFTELEFEARLIVIGQVKLADYKKIQVSKTAIKISAKELAEVLESLRGRLAEKKNVSRAAKKGDELLIDFEGFDSEGKPVAGADGKDYPLLLGSNSFIPGFEANLEGAKEGTSKSFTIAFPKDYGVKALRSKKVTFKVEVKEVNEITLPDVNNDFATKMGPFKTVDELKEDIRIQLTAERNREANRVYEETLLKEIASKSKVSIPNKLIDEQLVRMEDEERKNLAYRGQTWQEHLDAEGVTAEVHREKKRPSAEERIKIGILLSEIAEAEAVTVSPQELEVRMQLLKGQYKDSAAQIELEKPEVKQDILAQILTEKTLAKLVDYSK